MTAENILTTLLVNSAVFAVLFGLMLIVRKLLAKKISAALQYMLWAVVVIKLIVPFGFESNLSPFGLLAPTGGASPAAALSGGTAAEAPPADNAVYTSKVQPKTGPAENTAVADTRSAALQNASENAATKANSLAEPVNWTVAALVVWVAGIIAAGTLNALDARKLRRVVRRESAAPSARVMRVLEQCKRELGVRRHVNAVMQSAVNVPLVMGAFHPVLVLHEDLGAAGEAQIRHVCLHELAHIKYGDLAVISILNALCSLYWFNPLVWLCFRFIRKDIETACDARVLHRLGSAARQGYIGTVLQFAAREDKWHIFTVSSKRRAALCSEKAAMGMADGRLPMEQRLRGMFRKPRTGLSGQVIALTIAVLMLSAAALSACRPAAEEPESNYPVVYPQNNPEINILLAPKPPESYKIQEHWSDTAENEKVKILIDADVFMPDVTKYPAQKLQREVFSQQRVDELVNYFAKGKNLYLPCFTKSDYATWLEIAREGSDNEYTRQLEEMQAAAPEDLQAIYTDTTLKPVEYITGEVMMESGLWVMIGNGDADDGSISLQASPAGFSYSAYARFGKITDSKYLNREFFDRDKPEITQDEAVAHAEKVMSDLGIKNMFLVNAEISEVPGSPDKGGYKLEYARENAGIPLYWFMSVGRFAGEAAPPYTSPFTQEKLTAFITKDGLAALYWDGCAKVVETVSENTELMPFENIKQALIDRIFYKKSNPWDTTHYTISVISAELRMGYIGVKDNPNQALLVPAWVFRTQETYTENNKTRPGNEEVYMLNAIDGGAMELVF